MRRRPLLWATVLASCIDLHLEAPTPAPRLVELRSNGPSLDRLSRLPVFHVRFDAAMRAPDAASVVLFDDAASPAAIADALDGVLDPARAAHRVVLDVATEADDSTRWMLRVREVLPPSSSLTLVFTRRAQSLPGTALARDADSGALGTTFALRVDDALHAAPVLRAALGEAGVAVDARTLFLIADRDVVVGRADAAALLGSDGSVAPWTIAADDRRPDGTTRALRLHGLAPLRRGVRYGVTVAGVRSVGGVDAVVDPASHEAVQGTSSRPAFVDGTVCGAAEEPFAGACATRGDRWLTVRATTDSPATLRVAANSAAGSAQWSAVGNAGTAHRVTVTGLTPGATYGLAVEAIALDGVVGGTRSAALTTRTLRDPVRIASVLARPSGPTAQEFVELRNDGADAVALEGWALDGASGRSLLPRGATLRAHGRAVVVGPGFDAASPMAWGAGPLPAGVGLIRLPAAITGRGLRDTGDDLTLHDVDGAVIGYFPGAAASLAPSPGDRIVRVTTDLADDDPAAWAAASALP